MAAVLRTRTLSATSGFLEAPVAVDNDRLLGFTALGEAGGELIAVVQMAMLAGLPYTTLRETIFTSSKRQVGTSFHIKGSCRDSRRWQESPAEGPPTFPMTERSRP